MITFPTEDRNFPQVLLTFSTHKNTFMHAQWYTKKRDTLFIDEILFFFHFLKNNVKVKVIADGLYKGNGPAAMCF